MKISRLSVLFAFAGLLLHSGLAHAGHPFRGAAKWSVILCNYTDSPATPVRTPAQVADLFLNPGTGGLADFYAEVTRGSVNMSQSEVRGFFTIPMTVAAVRLISQGGPGGDRNRSFQLCVDAARNGGYTSPAGNFVAVVTSPEVDLWGGGGRAFLGVNHELGAFGHEISHGFGLDHSHSDNSSRPNAGEYGDPYDGMSYIGVLGRATTNFGNGGPGFNAFHLDRMGWLGRSEVRVFGADGVASATVTLTALYRSGFGGTRLVRIPYDPADLNRYFTVELRMATGWDSGFGSPIVLIHESRPHTPGNYRGFLQRDIMDGPPSQSLSRNGVTIRVLSVDAANGTAQVSIQSELPGRCLPGYVWREAGPNDRVCVTGAVRTATRQDNAAAASRRSPTGGPSGPDTCKPGFVWREAFAGDHVCVAGAVRTAARQENAAAASRVNPARFSFGPNTCQAGFVWREADDRDWVCVPPATRNETRQENALAATRRVGRTNTCITGFVWREAYPVDDKTCVPGTSRTRARNDNATADSRRMPF
jgi:hypothetical protein